MPQHHHERSEKICLNCGSTIHGRYCHVCGQENTEPRESIGHLLRHFFEDITHFDSKLLSSLKYLLFKPGFLAEAYMKGKRVSYLNPIRMYLFISAIFFLLLFTFVVKPTHYDAKANYFRDTIEQHNANGWFSIEFDRNKDMTDDILFLRFNKDYAVNGVHVYDSIQKASKPELRDDPFTAFIDRRIAAAASVYHRDPNGFIEKMSERFLHSFSQIFFISLPLFALLLQILYARRKDYFFVAHSVFSIHYYCFIFISILAFLGVVYTAIYADIKVITYTTFILMPAIIIWMYVYLYVAMLRFYKQGWFKTLLKFLVQSFFFTVIMILLTVAFFLNSMITLANT